VCVAQSHSDTSGVEISQRLFLQKFQFSAPVLSGGFHNVAIGNRNRGVNQTADAYRDGVTNLQNNATSQSISSSQQYESDMKVAIDQQAQAQISGVDAGAGQAIGGYQRGAARARGGVDKTIG
jgi:hypothetical protein